MACQCGCSTGAPRADLPHGAQCECGCGTGSPDAGEAAGQTDALDVASLARLVRDLDQRVRDLELETSRH